jgi:hypothetical protein
MSCMNNFSSNTFPSTPCFLRRCVLTISPDQRRSRYWTVDLSIIWPTLDHCTTTQWGMEPAPNWSSQEISIVYSESLTENLRRCGQMCQDTDMHKLCQLGMGFVCHNLICFPIKTCRTITSSTSALSLCHAHKNAGHPLPSNLNYIWAAPSTGHGGIKATLYSIPPFQGWWCRCTRS